MSANAMNIEDVYQLLNALHAETTGDHAVITPYDSSQFVSVANTLLQQGTDIVYNALMNTIAKTVFSTRPYSRQFGGLIVDNLKWGGIIRKIQFGDTDAVADSAFSGLPADGQSVDHYLINRGDVVETRYYGSAEYQDVMTVTRDQLVTAFSGPEQLGSFVSAKTAEMNNKWVQWTEDLSRGLVGNAIAAKTDYYNTNYATNMHVFPMLAFYNSSIGATPPLTIQDIYTPQYAKPFWEFVRANVQTLQRMMTGRHKLFYENAGNHNVIRHTPYRNQKVYLSAAYMDMMETSALAEAFNNEYLKYSDYESVSYWQNPRDPSSVSLNKYTYMDPTTGQYADSASGSYLTRNILGLIFDEDFMSINIKDTIIQNTPMNARGLYYDTWLTAHAQYCQDFTEKCIILTLN